MMLCNLVLGLSPLLAQAGGTVPPAGAAGGAAAAAGGATVIVFGCVAFLIAIASLVFWIWMLVDCVQRDFGTDNNEKVVWILVIVLTGIIGALIYFFVGRSRGVKPGGREHGVEPYEE